MAGAVGLATRLRARRAPSGPATVARAAPPARPARRRPSWPSPGTELTGHPKERLPGLLSIVARDTDGASVAVALDLEGIAGSVGSACTTGSTEVSHVLTAMGYPDEEARGALRLSLGPDDDRGRDRDRQRDRAARRRPSMRVGAARRRPPDPLGQGVPA